MTLGNQAVTGTEGTRGTAGTVTVPSQRRHGFRERHIRPRPVANLVYRAGVGVAGAAVVVTGVVLLPLPGPGWVVIFLGLGLLATEFAWAGRLLRFARHHVAQWTAWVQGQSRLLRGVVTAAGLALACGVAAAYLSWRGVPGWVPFV